MKAKTRLLAVLLTLLMVVGILPLSLFALDEKLTPTVQAGNAEFVSKSQEEIKAEFERLGMQFAQYQTFEGFTADSFKNMIPANGQSKQQVLHLY